METKSIFINDIRKYICILFGKIIYLTRRGNGVIFYFKFGQTAY